MALFNFFKKKKNKKITSKQGKKFEKKIQKYLNKHILVINYGKKYYDGDKEFVEIDVETPSTVIEIKGGQARGLKKQLDRYKVVSKKEPVAYAPNMRHESKKQTRKYYKIFDKKEDLKDYLISKGDKKKGYR